MFFTVLAIVGGEMVNGLELASSSSATIQRVYNYLLYKAQQEHIHQFLRDALVALPINIDDTFTSTYWVLMRI